MESRPTKCDIKGKNVPNDLGKSQPWFTRAKNGESKKRGCRCRFKMKQLYYVQDVVEIVNYNTRHANDDELVVHGEVWLGDYTWYAMQISQEHGWWIACLLGCPSLKSWACTLSAPCRWKLTILWLITTSSTRSGTSATLPLSWGRTSRRNTSTTRNQCISRFRLTLSRFSTTRRLEIWRLPWKENWRGKTCHSLYEFRTSLSSRWW
jgi:hypothetical protein